MGPLPLVTLCFVLGLFTPGVSPVWALALSLSLACAGGQVGVRRSFAGAVLLMSAGFCAGASQHHRLEQPALTCIPPTHAARVRGTVLQGCEATSVGTRCVLDTPDYGGVTLRLGAGRCGAAAGDVVEVVATVRAVVPDRNPPRVGVGGRGVLRGERFRLDAASCEIVGRSLGPLTAARRVALAARVALDASIERSFGARDGARARALLFGDTDGIDRGLLDDFRVTGLAHLLAVSGAHVALLVALLGGAFAWAMRAVPWVARRGRTGVAGATLSLVAVGVFAMLTGESASALRALAVAALGGTATGLGRSARAPDGLAAVTLGMLMVSPQLVVDVGFQLSVVASWALAAGGDDRERALTLAERGLSERVIDTLRAAFAANLRVSLGVAPILAWNFGRAPLLATVVNVLAAPLGEAVALPSVLLATLLPWPLDRAPAWLSSVALRALFALPELAARIPLASVSLPPPTPAECVVATVGVGLSLRCSWRAGGGLLAATALAVALLEARHRALCRPRAVLRVTALDVGQGDAIVVELPDGEAMLVDAGGDLTGAADPGRTVVVPWLRMHERESLAAVVLTHPHPDHAGGIPAVLGAVRAMEVWDTGQGSLLHANGAYARMREMASAMRIPIVGPATLCGGPRAFHGATIEVLSPCPRARAEVAPNDASFVMRLGYGRGSVLLPGDLEGGGEAAVLSRLGPTTVLKVGHHGSRTSTTDRLLDRITPRVAMISCGHPSIFGHPHPGVLERLLRRGIRVRRTDLEGAVTVTLRADGTVE